MALPCSLFSTSHLSITLKAFLAEEESTNLDSLKDSEDSEFPRKVDVGEEGAAGKKQFGKVERRYLSSDA